MEAVEISFDHSQEVEEQKDEREKTYVQTTIYDFMDEEHN